MVNNFLLMKIKAPLRFQELLTPTFLISTTHKHTSGGGCGRIVDGGPLLLAEGVRRVQDGHFQAPVTSLIFGTYVAIGGAPL